MVERYILILAKEMMERYGSDAVVQAVMRGEALRKQGNETGFEVWERVAATIIELEKS